MADALGGSERPPSQPCGKWQRSHRSTALGVPMAQIESWAATVMHAQKIGSRAAWAIMEPFQLNPGSTAWL